MNGANLLDMMEFVDPAFVKAADTASLAPKRKKWLPRVAVAACLALAVLAGVRFFAHSHATMERSLPLLTPFTASEYTVSWGHEGLLAYSPDELVGVCPWDETMDLKTLPVYQNLEHPADSDVIWTPPGDQRILNQFVPPRELPEGLKFGHDSSYAELEAVAEYLKATYADELGMAHPVVDIRGGDRDIYGRQSYQLYFYDGAGDVTDRLVARSLACQWWCYDDEGRIYGVWRSQYDLSAKAGDYPIITAAEARKLLCEGHYITTVPHDIAGEEYIARVELVYRTDRSAEYFMPYYRFLVEMPEAYFGPPRTEEQHGQVVDGQPVESGSSSDQLPDDGTGMRDYGAYYVPAVAAEYLTEMPVWDGSFNI